ncbi:tryptophan 2,3-dioxygenase family protein [Streptomyces sp. NPDC023588]|uniref:tryptophan 2,3-dioxygenase family protein n=1 Tax=Streptomyces sp. NPDC023588 TaxID=3154907 RepID=UPI0033C74D2A
MNSENCAIRCMRVMTKGCPRPLRHRCGSRTSKLREVRRWAAAEQVPAASDGISLARSVTEHVRRTGKHFLPDHLLIQLSEIRRRHSEGRPLLDAFLDCALDKHEGRFWNRTYLSLPVLELLMGGGQKSASSAERMSTLLISDIVRFEIEAACGSGEGPGAGRPDEATLATRLRHALRLATQSHARPEAGSLPSRLGDVSRSRLEDLADQLPRPPATETWRWFDVTAQPVSLLHDEYFFIRVLQAHEMIFTALAADVWAAISELRARRPRGAAERIDHGVALFERAAALFRIAATMRADQFSAFRQYTQGASAIQSEQYKRFEILCGVPPASRLQSAAFTSVPAVRAEAADVGHDSLARAYRDLRGEGGIGPAERDRLDAALSRLESRHQRWKSAHRSLAVRMLGDERGSGHTDGVPYLTRCLENRLFWQLGTSG